MSTLATLPLAFSGMALLSLSMERHSRQAAAQRRMAWRPAGWAMLAISLAVALLHGNWRFGLVEWIGTTGAAAALVVLTLAWRPAMLPAAAGIAAALGLAGGIGIAWA